MEPKMTTKQLASAAMGIALITVCSWISVPTAVPFTLQTFAICLISALFGLKPALCTVGGYILLGAIGVPVFSGFRGGPGVLLGTTGGYIIGCRSRFYGPETGKKKGGPLSFHVRRHSAVLCFRHGMVYDRLYEKNRSDQPRHRTELVRDTLSDSGRAESFAGSRTGRAAVPDSEKRKPDII